MHKGKWYMKNSLILYNNVIHATYFCLILNSLPFIDVIDENNGTPTRKILKHHKEKNVDRITLCVKNIFCGWEMAFLSVCSFHTERDVNKTLLLACIISHETDKKTFSKHFLLTNHWSNVCTVHLRLQDRSEQAESGPYGIVNPLDWHYRTFSALKFPLLCSAIYYTM